MQHEICEDGASRGCPRSATQRSLGIETGIYVYIHTCRYIDTNIDTDIQTDIDVC